VDYAEGEVIFNKEKPVLTDKKFVKPRKEKLAYTVTKEVIFSTLKQDCPENKEVIFNKYKID
jgi:hypothetical protein